MPPRVGCYAKLGDGLCIELVMAKPATPLRWPEYLIEAVAIGTFMVSAAVFAAVLYHPSSPFSAAISNELVRRAFMGLLRHDATLARMEHTLATGKPLRN